MKDPQRLFRIGDGSKATSDWWKKNLYPIIIGITNSLHSS
ncbi:hypothetical protein SPJ221_82 [Staphylococcus phage vB_SauH_SPJ2]|nr:hypothetical protein LSA2308_00119 [Staphylococcus phage LSA2308]USZ62891.1 hypothetical protein LSA2311_orf00083 [Staphylococcus phage LSA2311]WEW53631.1 hypothetical protein SPJ221_82 [Staphylococcus phage vB_SauH_SPJ2]